MSKKILCSILAFSAAMLPTGACAMTATPRPCHIEGGDKLPAKTGGASAVCDIVERAIASRALGLDYTADVNVRSNSVLKLRVVSKGRTLADQELTVMDQYLDARTIERFANAVADTVAKARKP